MAHQNEQLFCISVLERFPHYFEHTKVLDVGACDINGTNRYLFTDCDYTGLDAGPAKNVDIVSLAHEYNAPNETYDIIISTEMLEHDFYWDKSLQNMYRLLKPKGLMLITCATEGRVEHGTIRQFGEWHPNHAYDWGKTYYRNLTEADFDRALAIDANFDKHEFQINKETFDLYFWGIKCASL